MCKQQVYNVACALYFNKLQGTGALTELLLAEKETHTKIRDYTKSKPKQLILKTIYFHVFNHVPDTQKGCLSNEGAFLGVHGSKT